MLLDSWDEFIVLGKFWIQMSFLVVKVKRVFGFLFYKRKIKVCLKSYFFDFELGYYVILDDFYSFCQGRDFVFLSKVLREQG